MDMRTVPTEGPIVDINGRVALRALLVASACYCAARIGAALTVPEASAAIFWPPNAILLAGLLMSPLGGWWAIILAVLPMQVASQMHPAMPLALLVERSIGDCGGALLGAGAVHRLLRQRLRFDSLRHVGVFLLCCVLLVPVAASVFELALAGGEAWRSWGARLLANSLAALAIVPVALAWRAGTKRPLIAGTVFLLLCATVALAGTTHAIESNVATQCVLIGCGVGLLLLTAALEERRVARESLQRQQETLSLALDVAHLGTWELNLRSGTASCSLDLKRLFGLAGDASQLPLDALLEHLHPEGQESARRLVDRAAELGSSIETECQVVLPNGEQRCLLNKGVLGRSGHMFGVTLDVTERKRAAVQADEQARLQKMAHAQQEQLTYLTRVVVLGELSGALAHELNQPLAAILTNAQAARRFLRREPADLHEIGDILDDIVAEDKRAGEVIRRVRALFMKGDPVLQRLDINELVHDVLALTNSTLIERKVPVILELGSRLGAVQGDRVQLQQVLLNLIVNACEAMSTTAARGRQLGLLTGANGGDSTDGADSSHSVYIAVTDTGPGIAPEAMGQVFDSFFTTKTYGLGFGLSITRAIIEKHGGRIEAANRPEGGAVFRITLPLAGGGP